MSNHRQLIPPPRKHRTQIINIKVEDPRYTLPPQIVKQELTSKLGRAILVLAVGLLCFYLAIALGSY